MVVRDILLNKSCIIEYSRFKSNKRISADLVGAIIAVTEQFVTIQTKNKNIFHIPWRKIENIKDLTGRL